MLKMEGTALFGQHLALQGFLELLAHNALWALTQVISSAVSAQTVPICLTLLWVLTIPQVGMTLHVLTNAILESLQFLATKSVLILGTYSFGILEAWLFL